MVILCDGCTILENTKSIKELKKKILSSISPFCVCLKDSHWYEHPIWPRAEVAVKPAQTFEWLPPLICTKSLRAIPSPSRFQHVLETAKSIPKVSMWTDCMHEGCYMTSLAKWPWLTKPLFSCGERRGAHLSDTGITCCSKWAKLLPSFQLNWSSFQPYMTIIYMIFFLMYYSFYM